MRLGLNLGVQKQMLKKENLLVKSKASQELTLNIKLGLWKVRTRPLP